MERILLVSANQELSKEIRVALYKALEDGGEKPLITPTDNEEDAKAQVQDSYDLVITDLNIPADLTSTFVNEEYGLRLLRWMNQNNIRIPSILIAPEFSPAHVSKISHAINDLYKCSMVFAQTDDLMAELLARTIDVLREHTEPKHRYLDVEINLTEKEEGRRYTLHGVGFAYSADGLLSLKNRMFENLKISSRNIGSVTRWEETLQMVGRDLEEGLFEGNPEFYAHVKAGISAAGGSLKDTRVRFIIERQFHPVALESVMYPQADTYWMLQAPIYRRIRRHGSSTWPLFDNRAEDDRAPINCLIIDANVRGGSEVKGILVDDDNSPNGRPLRLERLKNVPIECDDLKDYLEDKRKDFNIGKVKLLRRKPGATSFSQEVEKVMRNQSWHLVHFGGHSYYDDKSKTGYVFFQDEQSIVKKDISEFSQWLRATRFIYLSSCHSSEDDFVFELTENQVPAVSGFRWDLDDHMAADYASRFYSHLFEERSLEVAFLKARQDMHRQHRTHRIWAAPMLILQV